MKLNILLILCLTISIVISSAGFISAEDTNKGITTYTPSSEKTCLGSICTLTLYSGISKVYEDGIWKNVEDARSLKGSGYKIDVIYSPKHENMAHAQEENIAHAHIEPSPEYRNQKPFRKLLERLANLAKWEIPPYELRQ
jgi:hypothetical protein